MYQDEIRRPPYNNDSGFQNQGYGYQKEYTNNNYEQGEQWQLNNQQPQVQQRLHDYGYDNQNSYKTPPCDTDQSYQYYNTNYGQGRPRPQDESQYQQNNQTNYLPNIPPNMNQNRSNFQQNYPPLPRQHQNEQNLRPNNQSIFSPRSPMGSNMMAGKPQNSPNYKNQSNYRPNETNFDNNTRNNVRYNAPSATQKSRAQPGLNSGNQTNYRSENGQQNNQPPNNVEYNNRFSHQQAQRFNQNTAQQRHAVQNSVVSHSQHSGGAVFGVVVKQPNQPIPNKSNISRNRQSYPPPQQNQSYNKQEENNYAQNNPRKDVRNFSNYVRPQDDFNVQQSTEGDDFPPPPPDTEQFYNNSSLYEDNLNQQNDKWRQTSLPPPPPLNNQYQHNDRNIQLDEQFQEHMKKDDYRPYRSAPDNNQPQMSPVFPGYQENNNQDNFNFQIQNNRQQNDQGVNNEYQPRDINQHQQTPTSPGSFNYPQSNRQYSSNKQQQRNYTPERENNQNYSRPQELTPAPSGSVEIPKPQNVKSVKNMFERKSNNAPPLFPKNNIRPIPPRPQMNKNHPRDFVQNNQNQNTNYHQPPNQYSSSPDERYQHDYQEYNNQRNNYQRDNKYDNQQGVLNKDIPPQLSNFQQSIPTQQLGNIVPPQRINQNMPQQESNPSLRPPIEDQQQDRYNQASYNARGSMNNDRDKNRLYNSRNNDQLASQYNNNSNYQNENEFNQIMEPSLPGNQMQYSINTPNQQQSYNTQHQDGARGLDVNFPSGNERKYVDVRDLINSKPINTQAQINQLEPWGQGYDNRGSRTSYTDNQHRYDSRMRESTGGYNGADNIQRSPPSSYKKPTPPQKNFYSKSMNNLDQVQDKPHIEIESYEEKSLNTETKFRSSPNLKPMVVAVAFHDDGFRNPLKQQNAGENYQNQPPTTIYDQQQFSEYNQGVTFTEPATQIDTSYQPRAVAQLAVEDNNDNSSELSNYLPSVVSRSYNAYSSDNRQPQYTQQQSDKTRQPDSPNIQKQHLDHNRQQSTQPTYSKTHYTVQNSTTEGIPTPPRTDRPPQQHKDYFHESAPKPIVSRQSSDESKHQRKLYANDKNWRVLTPTAVNQGQRQKSTTKYEQPVPPATTPPDYDSSDDEEDVDAPTPPASRTQTQFFKQNRPNIYEQNRPKHVIRQDNEVPKGYRPPNSNVTKVKPHLKIESQQPIKPQRHSGKPLSPTQPNHKEIISEEDSGIFEDKNGSTLSNVSSRAKITLGKSGAMGRRKPPTRMPSSQNIMEDVNDDFQIEVTNKDLQNKAKSIEVHREQSMKEIRKKEAMRKILLEKQHNEKQHTEDHVDEGVQTEYSGYGSVVSAPNHEKSTKLVFKVPQKSIQQKETKEIPIAATFEEPQDAKKQPKYDDLLGQFKTARDSALKSAHLKQAGALKAVSGLVKMTKKKEPEPTHKRITKPEKNLHVVQRAQMQYSQEVRAHNEEKNREGRSSPVKVTTHEYDKVEERPRHLDRNRDSSDRDRRNKPGIEKGHEFVERARDRQRDDGYDRRDNRSERRRDDEDNRRDRGRDIDDWRDNRRDRRSDDDHRGEDRPRYREDYNRRVSPPRSPRRDAYDDFKAKNVRHSPQKRDIDRREPSRDRRHAFDDDYRRERRSPPRHRDYDPRDREPDWVQQFRRNRGPDSRGSGSETSHVAKRAWVNDPRRKQRPNRELDMDEFEREVRAATSYNSDFEQPARPQHQVIPTKLISKKPPPRTRPNDDWMAALKQKNRVAERHRYGKLAR